MKRGIHSKPTRRRALLSLLPVLWLLGCPEPPPTLVLSGDEVLQQGPFSIDETLVVAKVDSTSLTVLGRITSDIDWMVTGSIDVALRDLNDSVIASGRSDINDSGKQIDYSVQLQPPLRVTDEAEFARYVIHVQISVNTVTLRHRRSLYSAIIRPEVDLHLPSLIQPGQAFPVVASVASKIEETPLLSFSLHHAPSDTSTPLGSLQVSPSGTVAGLVPVAEQAVAGAELVVDLLGGQHRHSLSTSVQVGAPGATEIILPGDSVAPGDTATTVAMVRSAAGVAAIEQSGLICLGKVYNSAFVCHTVTTDRAGVASSGFYIAADLAGQRLWVSTHFAGESQHTALQIADRPAVPGVDLLAQVGSANSGLLQSQTLLVGYFEGLEHHSELRLGDGSGPLVAEVNTPAQQQMELSLPLPFTASNQPQTWTLTSGVEDALGRRSATSIQAVTAVGDIVVRAWVHPHIVEDEPIAVLVTTRDLRGLPVPAQGVLVADQQEYPFTCNSDGLALVSGFTAQSGEQTLVATAQDSSGRSGETEVTFRVFSGQDPRLDLDTPLLATSSPLQVELTSQHLNSVLGVWLTAGGKTLDAQLGSALSTQLHSHTDQQVLAVHAFGVDQDQRILHLNQPLLGPAPPISLELVADQGSLTPLIRDRSGAVQNATLVITQEERTAQTQVSLAAIRRALEAHPARPQQKALLQAVTGNSETVELQLTAKASSAALAVAQAKVEKDIAAISSDIASSVEREDLAPADLEEWVERRARVFYDPWGQAYHLQLELGRLWLTSHGLDEVEATEDDLLASRYLHEVFSQQRPELPLATPGSSWQAAIRPHQLYSASVDADTLLTPNGAGLTIRAQTASGRGTTTLATPDPQATLALSVEQHLVVRRGDRFSLPVFVRAPPGQAVTVSITSSDTTAVHIGSPLQVELSSGETGVVGTQFVLRQRNNQSTGLTVTVSRLNQQVARQVVIEVAEADLDLAVLARGTSLVSVDTSSVQLAPTATTSRQSLALQAIAFADAGSLARWQRDRMTSPSQALLDESIYQLHLLASGGERLTHEYDQLLATLAVHQNKSGGFIPSQSTEPSVELTLTALEALLATERTGQSWTGQSSTGQSLTGQSWTSTAGAVNFLLGRTEDNGALTALTSAADTATLNRSRLRSTARLLRILLQVSPDSAATSTAQQFLQAHLDQADDSLSLAHVLRALVAANSENSHLSQVSSALLQHQSSGEEDQPAGVFPGLPSDGAHADIYATALSIIALSEAGTSWDILQPALPYLIQWAHPTQMQLPPQIIPLWLQALEQAPDQQQATVSLSIAGQPEHTLDTGASQATQLTVDAVETLQIELTSIAGHQTPVVLWLSGVPALPLRQGPGLTLESTSQLTLQVGTPVLLPLSVLSDGAPVWLETRTAPCMGVAFAIQGVTVKQPVSGRLNYLLTAANQDDDLQLLLAPTCKGTVTLPTVRAHQTATPWLVSTTHPLLVNIQ